jgi:hypothetical protein
VRKSLAYFSGDCDVQSAVQSNGIGAHIPSLGHLEVCM